MTAAHYSGSAQSAADVAYAVTQAGYEVVASSPGTSPRAATAFWTQARAAFAPEALEQGLPRDYRALLRDPQGTLRLLHVRQGGTLHAESSGAVSIADPPGPQQPPGVSMWQSLHTGDAHPVFVWDGTELGFCGLVDFFQLHRNLLSSLAPTQGGQGLPTLRGTAVLLRTEHVYEFEMNRRSRFLVSDTGALHTLTPDELHAGFRPVW
ncbi:MULTISPECIES: hypothetical protein [Brevibacterium]|uniref:Uncharacterized protein n=1 Tax=Brevibacterium salitolerans TaxID=1403566 RepID=A0ABP5IDM0_9MICO|nr:hypothetical protein [Brevibacterium sp.]